MFAGAATEEVSEAKKSSGSKSCFRNWDQWQAFTKSTQEDKPSNLALYHLPIAWPDTYLRCPRTWGALCANQHEQTCAKQQKKAKACLFQHLSLFANPAFDSDSVRRGHNMIKFGQNLP